MEAETCLEYPRPPTLIHKVNYKVNVFCAKMVSEGSLPVEFSFIESCVVVWIAHCDSISRSGLQVSRRHSLPLTEWLPGQTNHKCVCHTIYVMYISFTADLYIHWSFIFFFLIFLTFFCFWIATACSPQCSPCFSSITLWACHGFHNDNMFTSHLVWVWGVVWEVEFVGFSVMVIV